jgi:hypothetical protein
MHFPKGKITNLFPTNLLPQNEILEHICQEELKLYQSRVWDAKRQKGMIKEKNH